MCLDRTADGGWTPGGPALYAARCARALGARVTLVTHLTPGYDRAVLEGLDVVGLSARQVPQYANTYAGGVRAQLLLARGKRFRSADLERFPGGDGLIVAPAFRELRALPAADAGLTVVTLQGTLRAVSTGHKVVTRARPLPAVMLFLRPGAFAVFSEEDTTAPERLAHGIALSGATAVLTRGSRGATVFRARGRECIAPIAAREVDPTGAGDCFAAAFAVRMLATGNEREAFSFAAATAALAVEAAGLANLPTVGAVEARLARGAA